MKFAALVVVALPALAHAQPAASPGRLELAGGLLWAGRSGIGTAEAAETAPSGARSRLFLTSTALDSTAGLEGGLLVRLTPAVSAGASVTFAAPTLRTSISGDAENIPDLDVTETVSSAAVEGVMLLHLPGWRLFDRGVPFASAGGGFIRYLHEGRTVVETGAVYRVGAGLDFVLRDAGRGRVKAAGVRADLRAVLRSGGVAFDDRVRVSPGVGIALFARF